jgi:hypothetical protein
MARTTDEQIAAALQPFLEPGEQILNSAYGIAPPGIGMLIMTGAIGQAFFTKYYLLALTNRRLLQMQFKNKLRIIEIREYRHGNLPQVTSKQGTIFAVLQLNGPEGSYKIKFHRASMANNRERAMYIANAISSASPVA